MLDSRHYRTNSNSKSRRRLQHQSKSSLLVLRIGLLFSSSLLLLWITTTTIATTTTTVSAEPTIHHHHHHHHHRHTIRSSRRVGWFQNSNNNNNNKIISSKTIRLLRNNNNNNNSLLLDSLDNDASSTTSYITTTTTTTTNTILQQLRGGGGDVRSDDEESEEDDEDEDDESDLDDMEDDDDDDDDDDDEALFADMDEQDFDEAEEEFAEANYAQQVWDHWQATPPFTKSYLTASMAVTAYGYLFNGNEFPSLLELDFARLLSTNTKSVIWQLWRPFTTFLNFGPFGLGYVMTVQFVWTYMSTLERLHHANPYDFWIMIVFGQLCMVIGYPILKLSPKFLGHNLSTFLVYVWSRFHEGMDVNMFELFTSKAEMLPWLFLAQTFLLEGEPPVLDLLGIVFGHVFYHCKSIGLLRAPPAVVEWYQKGDSELAKYLKSKYRVITEDFQML